MPLNIHAQLELLETQLGLNQTLIVKTVLQEEDALQEVQQQSLVLKVTTAQLELLQTLQSIIKLQQEASLIKQEQ